MEDANADPAGGGFVLGGSFPAGEAASVEEWKRQARSRVS